MQTAISSRDLVKGKIKSKREGLKMGFRHARGFRLSHLLPPHSICTMELVYDDVARVKKRVSFFMEIPTHSAYLKFPRLPLSSGLKKGRDASRIIVRNL